MRRFATVVFLLVGFSGTTVALGGDWKSPKGFTLSFPDTWKVATEEQMKAAAAAGAAAAQKAGGNEAAKAPPLEVILVGPVQDKFAANINVIIIPQAITLNAMTEGQIVGQAKTGLFMAGIKVGEIKTSHVEVDKRPGFSMAFEQGEGPDDAILRCWKVFVSGAKQTYLINCVAKKSQWAAVYPDFKKIIGDMHFDVNP
jgi:hypothetical protein